MGSEHGNAFRQVEFAAGHRAGDFHGLRQSQRFGRMVHLEPLENCLSRLCVSYARVGLRVVDDLWQQADLAKVIGASGGN